VIGWMRIVPGPYGHVRGESATGGPHPTGPYADAAAQIATTAPPMRELDARARPMCAILRMHARGS
jgi:hypothetical protein